MITVTLAHTSDVAPQTLAAVRGLLDVCFDWEFTDEDWDHTLGGMHALAWDGDELVGHGAVVLRRLMHGGRTWRTGYVEGVATRPDRRREGVGETVMDALEDVVRGGYELGALSSSDAGLAFWAARGWQRWQGETFALTPSGVVRTPEDDDAVFVLPVRSGLDVTQSLTCDWRDGETW